MSSDSIGRGRAVITVLVATLAMVATLPGRTVGLGLVTEPLIADFDISRTQFATLNLWATMIGACFVFITGPCLDRWGVRYSTTAILGLFGGAVLWLVNLPGPGMMLVVLILVRGLGQTSLSLASVTVLGKNFGKKLSVAMGVFAVLVAILFVVAIEIAGGMVKDQGWRWTYNCLGIFVLFVGLLAVIFLRNGSETLADEKAKHGLGLLEALRTPVMWVLTIGIGIYYFAFTGFTLFRESIVASIGFEGDAGKEIALSAVSILMGAGLLGNLASGWLAQKIAIMRIFAVSMFLITFSLLAFLLVNGSQGMLYGAMVALGVGGGAVSVVFFTGFAQIFGRLHLGQIQGVAQAVTVAASATGPLAFALVFERSLSSSPEGSYGTIFVIMVPIALISAIWSFIVPLPDRADEKA